VRWALIVATGAHAFTGVQLRHLDDLLEGNPTITFQFNYGDVAIGEWTGPLDRPTPWTMPPELSAIVDRQSIPIHGCRPGQSARPTSGPPRPDEGRSKLPGWPLHPPRNDEPTAPRWASMAR